MSCKANVKIQVLKIGLLPQKHPCATVLAVQSAFQHNSNKQLVGQYQSACYLGSMVDVENAYDCGH